jgi:Kef-type K+ transport system membrane component KefB
MEHVNPLLIQASLYFAAAVLGVVLSHRLGLGSVAGYLIAGIAIGPWGLNLVGQIEDVRAFAELGVVFLLFVIGLELEPKRLWEMRGRLLRLGLSQMVASIAAIAAIAWAFGFDPRIGVVIGMALALSSTAFALQPLAERGGLGTQGGQATFAVLLFQDLAVIPMLALLPLFGAAAGAASFSWHRLGIAVLVIAATLIGGHYSRAARVPPHRTHAPARDLRRVRTAPGPGDCARVRIRWAVDGARRVSRRDAARRVRIPPRDRGGHRTVQGIAARPFLHRSRHDG